MGKRMARKVSGSACGAESLATTKPVAHIRTNRAGAAAISRRVDGVSFMRRSMRRIQAGLRDLKNGSRHVRSAKALGTVSGWRHQSGWLEEGHVARLHEGLATGGVAGGLAGILLGGKTSKKLAPRAPSSSAARPPSRALPTRSTTTGRPRSRRHRPRSRQPPMKDITPSRRARLSSRDRRGSATI